MCIKSVRKSGDVIVVGEGVEDMHDIEGILERIERDDVGAAAVTGLPKHVPTICVYLPSHHFINAPTRKST